MAHYDELKIREYQHWTLYLHGNQYYLGRAYVWLRRPGEMQRLSKLKLPERDELDTIFEDYEHAVKHLWNPDHMNYAWLGNEIDTHGGHGHMHLIPRYKPTRVLTFADNKFEDGQWGKNYAPYPKWTLLDATLFKIRDAIREQII